MTREIAKQQRRTWEEKEKKIRIKFSVTFSLNLFLDSIKCRILLLIPDIVHLILFSYFIGYMSVAHTTHIFRWFSRMPSPQSRIETTKVKWEKKKKQRNTTKRKKKKWKWRFSHCPLTRWSIVCARKNSRQKHTHTRERGGGMSEREREFVWSESEGKQLIRFKFSCWMCVQKRDSSRHALASPHNHSRTQIGSSTSG